MKNLLKITSVVLVSLSLNFTAWSADISNVDTGNLNEPEDCSITIDRGGAKITITKSTCCEAIERAKEIDRILDTMQEISE